MYPEQRDIDAGSSERIAVDEVDITHAIGDQLQLPNSHRVTDQCRNAGERESQLRLIEIPEHYAGDTGCCQPVELGERGHNLDAIFGLAVIAQSHAEDLAILFDVQAAHCGRWQFYAKAVVCVALDGRMDDSR